MEDKICGIRISNPNKIVFEKGKITKLDVVKYYMDVAPLMLKFISKRPISAFRCHGGINGECFFKKHPTTDGDNVEKFLLDGSEFYFIQNKSQLIFQVQMGTIEFHTWGSKYPNVEFPDMIAFDLDPAEDVSLAKLRDGVLKIKSVLDELGLDCSLKTSGGKGYHILVPLKKKRSWDELSELSKQISVLIETKWQNLFTTNMRKDKRSGKIYLDFLRNKRGASLVAPFSLRAREGAPISMPISFENLYDVKPNEVNIKNYKKFLDLI